MNAQQYKSKNHDNECWIIQKWKPQKYMFNKTKIKTAKMHIPNYKSKNHKNTYSITQK